MSTEEQIASLRSMHLSFSEADFDARLGWCESPIERLFLAHAITWGDWYLPDQREFAKCWTILQGIEGVADFTGLMCSEAYDDTFLTTQLVVGKYRLDFALYVRGDLYDIELDGHEFHERTKEQAQRDKSRDRELTSSGWRVLRFTGSEIHRDVKKCWMDVRTIMFLTCFNLPPNPEDPT
jgi:very-short-patch-repair endonuclease